MYKITADNNTIWSPGYDKRKLVSPKLSLETNKIGSLSFTIYPTHPNYDSLVKMQSIITVYQDEEVLFKGRIFSDKADFRKTKKVVVEDLLGYFNDSTVRPYSYQGSVSDYLEFLITQHNNQEPEYKQFKLGIVTVTDPNDYITRASSDYPQTWDEINNKLIKLLGGYIVIRYEEDGNYIDYLENFISVSPQKIEYAVNLLDLDNEVKADNLATCIVPLGASIQGGEGNNTRVTIASVNNGVDYIYDPVAEAIYGRISKVVTWDDVTKPSNLLTKANAYLKTAILLEGTLNIKAVDLHLSDDQIKAFRIGQYIPVYSVPHEINENMLLNSFSLDLSNPASFSFSLGRTKTSFVDTQFSNNRTSEKLSKVSQEITEIKQDVNDKVEVNQGSANKGKYLGIDDNGNVVPLDPPTEFNIHNLTDKSSIADSDEIGVYNVTANSHRKITWTLAKATLKTYFDKAYAALNHKHKVADIEDFPDLSNSYAYQAEEVVVGSWFGADLYRRVFQIEALETEAGSYSYSHGIEGIDLVTKVYGVMIASGVTTYFSNVSANTTDIFYTLDMVTESSIGYLVIEYTKLSGEEKSKNDNI